MRDIFGISSLFDTAHDPFQRAFLGTMSLAPESEIWEKDGVTYIEIDVPGVSAEDVDIQAQDQIVNVNWKRRVRGTEEKSYRNYRVSKDVDLESIQAKVENGLLTIELRKIPKAAPRRIPVLGASPAVAAIKE